MKLYAPSYYQAFSCLMGACRHSCCIGWEIDVDSETHAYYRTVGGEIGRELCENIAVNDGVASFRLTQDERCPFLNEEGLCRLILSLGEDCLCQICADHPRFRSFFSDRTELGLGLCCEGAAALILNWPQSVSLEILEDDGAEEALQPEEEALLSERQTLMEIAQDRSLCIRERARQLCAQLYMLKPDWKHWQAVLLKLERMDDTWAEHLQRLTEPVDENALKGEGWEIAFEQLLVYLLMRHMPAALEDGDMQLHAGYALLMWQLLRRLCAGLSAPSVEDLAELARLYSSEIEYSDENVDAILDEIVKEIFIGE